MKKRIMSIMLVLALTLALSSTAKAETDNQALYESYCVEIGAQYGISAELLEAICFTESSWKPTVKSADGRCIGLMQINPVVHKDRMAKLGVTDITDPYSNILVGADYIAELSKEYGDLYDVLSIYNSGHTGIVTYPKKVTEKARELELEHYGY